MNWNSFFYGVIAMNTIWTLIHWAFPQKPKRLEHLTESLPE